jgi:hypothetical protein
MDIRAGEVVVFDKAYVDFSHLHTLTQRDVFWVTRAKDNLAYEIVGQQTLPSGPVLLDALGACRTLKHCAAGAEFQIRHPPLPFSEFCGLRRKYRKRKLETII